FGGEWQRYTVEIRNQFRRAGHFQFAGSSTTGTGNTLADFLLGQLSSFDQGTGEYKDYVTNYGSLFFQDDFKTTNRLSLNLGARLESTPPWHEKVGRIEYFSLKTFQQNLHSSRFPAAPRGELFRGDPGVAEDGTDPSVYNFGPRVGFAWDITGDGKTSLRGGGGAFYDQHRDGESGNGAVNAAPWNLRLSVTRPSGPFSDPYRGPSDFNLITDGTIGTQQAIFPTPVLIETLDQNYKTPVTYNFNLTLEREVVRGVMARAAYVGSRNRNGRFTRSLNPAIATIPGATVANTDARRLYAADGLGVVNQQVQDRRSNYNGMQLTLSKRYSHGFQITSTYTLSKIVGDFAGERQSGGELIPYFLYQDPALLWGPLDQDHRHRFTTSWVMDLPGESFKGVARWLLGGWQWSGVMQYQTGRPFTVTSGTDNSLDGIGNDRAKLTGADIWALPTTACANCVWWFNPAAFATNDLGTFGNVPKNAYYRPSLHTWDMGLSKNFRFNGTQYVQFRAEFFNIFNMVNFDIPNTGVNNQATLGRITQTDPSSGDPRIVQFGLKFVF